MKKLVVLLTLIYSVAGVAQNKRVLFVVTNHTQLGNTGETTGYFLSEVTHPLEVLTEAGYKVDFVSPKGGTATAYGVKLDDPINKKYWENADYQKQLAHTLAPSQVKANDYAAIFYAGGHGTMWDFANSEALAKIAQQIYEKGGVVAAVCHGPSGLVNIKLSNGKYLVSGKTLSPFTNEEEEAVKLSQVVPYSLENKLKERGAIIDKAGLWQDKVSVDNRVITGQNPQSAKSVGEAILKELQKSPLRFDASKYTTQQVTQGDQTFTVRAYEGIVYIANPVEEQYQQLNLYIPEAYFNGETINGFNAQTAPIFFPNGVGGYMPAKPLSLTGGKFKDTNNSLIMALSKGFVVASPGARGRTSATGKAPAVIVDLKAAMRYLKYNDKEMPGDANKIISNGTSAGGASSALLGASGDQAAYEPYLKELGAAPATDAIFAVSAYCPITNLENADKAYEWQFGNLSQYKTMEISMLDYNVQRTYKTGTFTAEQTKVSADLKKDFPAYLNSLQLKDRKGKRLTLNAKGEGSFKELLKQTIIAAAEKAQKGGTDLSQYSFLTLKNGKVTAIDWEGYITYMERHKTPPAFDALDLSTGENQLFGDSTTDKKHFTPYALKNSTTESQMADANIVKLMNPMSFIGKKNAHLPKYWRIRHGAKDSDTSAAISLILATTLQNYRYIVDYALPWDKPHSGDYDLEELFDWAEKISK